jgi:hypothetical protein
MLVRHLQHLSVYLEAALPCKCEALRVCTFEHAPGVHRSNL